MPLPRVNVERIQTFRLESGLDDVATDHGEELRDHGRSKTGIAQDEPQQGSS